MAAKTPTSITKHNLGSLTLLIAKFETASTNDIDDNDTWASGITTMVCYPIVQPILDGPQDCTIDAVDFATGDITFASAADQLAHVFVLCRNM